MGLASNFIILMILGSVVLLRNSSNVSDKFKPFLAAGTIAFTFFGMTQLLFNQFGFDRGGFRSLVLLPVPRKYILLGKNLALMPFAVGTGLIFLVVIKFAVSVSSLVILAAALQVVAAFLLLSMAGNLLSMLAPYRIAAGSLKPTKMPPLITVAIVVSHMLFPIFMVPIFLPPLIGLLVSLAGWLPAAPVNLFFSVILLVILTLSYKFSLRTLGNLLQQREKQILQVVTQEIE
jgi:ABC-2 type transport system permease protein